MLPAASHQNRTVALLETCQQQLLTLLQPKLAKLFEDGNTAFLEFAEKAQTGKSRLSFMDAMSILQEDRSGIERRFYREIAASFSGFSSRPSTAAGKSRQRKPSTQMSLQSKEDADIEVAIKNMISTASLGATLTIGAILQRLAVLNQGRKLQEPDIPGGPSCLAHAFHAAVQDLVLDHETRLVVYLLFDKIVLANTRPLYEEYNKLLLKAGILPYLKYEVPRNPNTGKSTSMGDTPDPARKSRLSAQQNGSLADELFSSVLELIAQRNGLDQKRRPDSRGTGAEIPLTQQEVVTAIHRVQKLRRQDPVSSFEVDPSLPQASQQEQLIDTMRRRIGAEREQLFMGIDRRRLPSADLQIIDLVGMMFEYMLRDQYLPSIAKAELSRLHTPYLKIAIADKSLFTNINHPAHRLLNNLAHAGTRWVFENNPERGIFPCIRTVVQRIIEEFESNFEIFTELQELLETNVRTLEDKSASIEERSRQAATGREKLDQARNAAATSIESLVTRYSPPPEMRKFLGDVWLDKLMFIYLREPGATESPAWKLATGSLETILWSIQPRVSDEARGELADQLPDIRKQTARAFEMLSNHGTSDYSAQLELISRLQDKAVSPEEYEPAGETPAPPEAAASTAAGTHAQEAAAVPAPERTWPNGTDKPYLLTPAEKAAQDKLRKTAFGTWFTMQADPDQLPQQLKLSWYSRISGNYMFVDSMGVKASMIHQNKLAALLVSGNAVILEQEQQPFIQRTLEMIRRMLGGGLKSGTA
jgi:hypothetical protein